MDVQFVDRILTCFDCHSDFIFTAGEQLFFLDKQFKNDPKRCKPCKSRRSSLTVSAAGGGPAAAGLSRTETRTECSECGVETTVPFKPTQGRPVLCRYCFQVKTRALASSPSVDALNTRHAPHEPEMTQAQTATALTGVSMSQAGVMLSADAAVLAAASMSAASAASSVASAADLASISTASTSTSMSPTRSASSIRSAEHSFAASTAANELVAVGLLTSESKFPEA